MEIAKTFFEKKEGREKTKKWMRFIFMTIALLGLSLFITYGILEVKKLPRGEQLPKKIESFSIKIVDSEEIVSFLNEDSNQMVVFMKLRQEYTSSSRSIEGEEIILSSSSGTIGYNSVGYSSE